MSEIDNVEEVVLAVADQDMVVALFEDLFGLEFKDGWTVPVDEMKVRSAHIGKTQFHIIASTSPDALIGKFVRDKGEGIHHIAFRVRNLDEMIARLRKKGIKLVPEEPRRSERNARYIFIHPKSAHGMLIELMERL